MAGLNLFLRVVASQARKLTLFVKTLVEKDKT